MIYSGNKFGMCMLVDELGQVDEYPLKRKLVMKGGHTHNHKWNSLLRSIDRSKDSRRQKHNFEQYKRCCEFTWMFPWNHRWIDWIGDV